MWRAFEYFLMLLGTGFAGLLLYTTSMIALHGGVTYIEPNRPVLYAEIALLSVIILSGAVLIIRKWFRPL